MGRLPRWAKGQKRECAICGCEFPERDFRLLEQEGKWVCKWDYDSLTDKQRAEELKRTLK